MYNMKIKKVLLYNFNNCRHKTVIDFNKDITFLMGSNGIWKTTVFDAIELGLTGDILRISSKEKIIPENPRGYKPFFQNDSNYSVIIKVWIDNGNEEQLIVVRKYDNTKKICTSSEFLLQFQLFQQEEISDSNFEDIDNNGLLHKISQDTIDKFLGVSGKYEIKNIFNIFNYIQQEETTFFLKQSQQERRDNISFLIKTDEVEKKIDRIKKVTDTIEDTIYKFESEKEYLKNQ